METTYNNLSNYEEIFFNKLRNYLNTKIYFFGSIQRDDYFPGKSDIDVEIFTTNESSTIIQLQNFLGVERSEIKRLYFLKNNELIFCNKVKYEEPENKLFVEICIINEKYKNKKLIIIKH